LAQAKRSNIAVEHFTTPSVFERSTMKGFALTLAMALLCADAKMRRE